MLSEAWLICGSCNNQVVLQMSVSESVSILWLDLHHAWKCCFTHIRDPNWTRAFVASFFKRAYFFGAFNQKLAKLESSKWIFWFSSAYNYATSNAKLPQASTSTQNGNWTCQYNTSSSSWKHSLKFACKFVKYWTRSCFTLGNNISLSVVARNSL